MVKKVQKNSLYGEMIQGKPRKRCGGRGFITEITVGADGWPNTAARTCPVCKGTRKQPIHEINVDFGKKRV